MLEAHEPTCELMRHALDTHGNAMFDNHSMEFEVYKFSFDNQGIAVLDVQYEVLDAHDPICELIRQAFDTHGIDIFDNQSMELEMYMF